MKRFWSPVRDAAGLAFGLLLLAGFNVKAETKLVVAADGSGQFISVQAAINAVPRNIDHRSAAMP